MSTYQPSLKTFLAAAKDALAAKAGQRSLPLTFVAGNESAGKNAPKPALAMKQELYY